MKTENELLQHIYQDASMATFTLTKLLENLKEKDNKIKDATEDILKEYEQFAKTSKQLLQEQKIIPQEESMMAKMGASMGIKKEVINDGPTKLNARRKIMAQVYDIQEQRMPKESKTAFIGRTEDIFHPLLEKIFNLLSSQNAELKEGIKNLQEAIDNLKATDDNTDTDAE